MARQIALLRGINLGSHKRVKMAELRELLTGLGYEDVRTLLQSGNVVLSSGKAPGKVREELERRIAADLGVETQVVTRTRDELADVIERNPLADVAVDPKKLQVSFLSKAPSKTVADGLAAADITPERVAVSGREIYAWHPDGVHRSPLAKLLPTSSSASSRPRATGTRCSKLPSWPTSASAGTRPRS